MERYKDDIYGKAYDFAVKIVTIYKTLCNSKKEFVLSKQLLRSGTSIGANVSEANGAISKAEFSAKMSIAYKECRETKYWLNLLKDTGYLSIEEHKEMFPKADELGAMLYRIIKTSRSGK
ncbi:four helix bundle protein [candidate division TA06 bacterium]|uniref:Four helix bundle protein n=1 Tax=candidate division TA06 bacterium TaxID=2250710 RepID=A0A933MJR4_UNCT6|nr:four helix bundle protein [candidate division TA06 bacterium]